MRPKMKKLIASVTFATALMAMTQAGATTYTYTGNASPGGDGNNYYVSLTADLNCAGSCSGTYSEGSGLTSFTLSIDNASNNLSVFSVSNGAPGYTSDGSLNYLTLSNAGSVTSWAVIADNGVNTIYTIGNDPFYGTQDLFQYGSIQSGTLDANPGKWSPTGDISATPLPSTWTMLIAAFVGFGFLAYRGTKKNAVPFAAA